MQARLARIPLMLVAGGAALAALASTATGRAPIPERCVRPADHAKVIRFRTTDRIVLAGAMLGSGKTGVVLVPQIDDDYCGFLSFARVLAGRGHRLVIRPRGEHGTSLLDGPGGAPVRSLVFAFLRSH